MNLDLSYRTAFFFALGLHLLLAVLLFMEPSHQRPVMTLAKNEPSQSVPVTSNDPSKEIVKATSVDSQDVMKTIEALKQARSNQLQAEKTRQRVLAQQVEMARKARLKEQEHLAKLKDEAEKIAIARKKRMEDEQRRLKQLAMDKEKEAKRLQALKEQQEKEAKKLALLKKKQVDEQQKAKEEKERVAKFEIEKKEKAKKEWARIEKAKAELAEKQRQAAAEQAADNAAKQAQLAGEVNKYKAMIVDAIGRQWILPENVNRDLSSQFRIRLAPGGAVLEVNLIRSSGDPVLDRSAQTAIYKASPLPVPTDSTTFDLFRDISLTVRPEHVRG